MDDERTQLLSDPATAQGTVLAPPRPGDRRPGQDEIGDRREHRSAPSRPLLLAALGAALAAVGALTLLPVGTGWAWGSPFDEVRWYLTSLDDGATMLQLVGNLSLLAVPTALAILLWPTLERPGLLASVALAAGTSIELLQRLLPLGRVVSPLDALLNAAGAVAAGLIVRHVHRLRQPAMG